MSENVADMGLGNPLSKKSSSFFDTTNLARQAELMRDSDHADEETRKNLMFEEKEVSLFHIFTHLGQPIDYLYLVLAIIGALGSGLTMPLMAYFSSDMMSEVGNTGEYSEDKEKLESTVKDAMNKQIKRFLIIGAAMFVANFLSIAFWTLLGSRLVHQIDRKSVV